MGKDGRIVIPKLMLTLLKGDKPNLESYVMEVTLEPTRSNTDHWEDRHTKKQRCSKNDKHTNWALGFGFMCVVGWAGVVCLYRLHIQTAFGLGSGLVFGSIIG